MKSSLEGLVDSRFEQAEERISKLEPRSIEMIYSEEKKEKRIKRKPRV
ncbi:hypothetical protein TUM15756_20450 [Neisseria gonorrhoeae]|nr:hypothetical protein TUM15756_20450 [Neisseria gonorrhoeae]